MNIANKHIQERVKCKKKKKKGYSKNYQQEGHIFSIIECHTSFYQKKKISPKLVLSVKGCFSDYKVPLESIVYSKHRKRKIYYTENNSTSYYFPFISNCEMKFTRNYSIHFWQP